MFCYGCEGESSRQKQPLVVRPSHPIRDVSVWYFFLAFKRRLLDASSLRSMHATVEEGTSLDRQRTGELEPTRGLLCPINVSSQQFVYQGLGLRLGFRKNIFFNVNQLFDPHKDGKTNMCVCVCVYSCVWWQMHFWIYKQHTVSHFQAIIIQLI